MNIANTDEQWFNKKEVSAGEKRLKLTWWIYKHFGVFPIRLIAFFITLGTILIKKDIRVNSKKYFQVLFEFTQNKKYKPSFLNSFKHTLNYSYSLIDKMLAYTDNYKNISYDDNRSNDIVFELINKKRGAFFITTHIGNVEMLRALIADSNIPSVKINVFLQASQCEIFNRFINNISNQKEIVKLYPVENIDINTSIEIQEKLDNGEFVFMAGDRLSAGATESNYETKLLNRKILLPLGVMRFALMLKCPIFASICAKENDSYSISTEEFNINGSKEERLKQLQEQYTKVLEKYTLKYPYQFYHFYDVFEDSSLRSE